MRTTFTEEQRQKNREEMDVESLAIYVLRDLKEKPKTYLDGSDFSFLIDDFRNDAFPEGNQYQRRSDNAKILEAVTLLERRGLVMRNIPGQLGTVGENCFSVFLTSIGIKSSIDDDVILLIDKPEEIVGKLEARVGDLDDVVRQYYIESLRAYQEGLYISSVICLGAASERAIYLLAGAIQSYSEKYQEGIKKRRHISGLTKYLSDSVIPIIFTTDKEFARELKDLLDELGKLYRKNRNDAGHPETIEQTNWLREDQEILLVHFRRYITTICEAIGKII